SRRRATMSQGGPDRLEVTCLEDKLGLQAMELAFQPHGVLMRIHEPLYASVEPRDLSHGTRPRGGECRRIIDASTFLKDRHEEIFPGRPVGHELLPSGIHGVDEGTAVLYPQFLVVYDVSDELTSALHASNLL